PAYHIKRTPGTCNQERAQSKAAWQAPGAAKKHAMPYVKCGASIVQADIVVRRRQRTDSRCITVRIVQRVIAEQGELRTHPHAGVDDELVLLVHAFGLILINIPGIWVGPWVRNRVRGVAWEHRADRCVSVLRKELMYAA